MSNVSSICIKIARDVNVHIDRRKIIKAFYERDPSIIHYLKYVSQQFNNYTWVISFDASFQCSKLIGSFINIEGINFEIEEVTDPSRYKTYTYRVLWLPHGFSSHRVEGLFAGRGSRVVDCREEMFQVDGINDLSFGTGNFRVKVQYDVQICSVPVKSGMYELEKRKVLISRFGENPKCLKCNQEGHIRKNCPLNKLKCDKCQKTGHVSEKCNMALATANEIEAPDEYDKEADELVVENTQFVYQKPEKVKRKNGSPIDDKSAKTSKGDKGTSESSSDSEVETKNVEEYYVETSQLQEEFNKQFKENGKSTANNIQAKSNSKTNVSTSKLQQPKVAKNNSKK